MVSLINTCEVYQKRKKQRQNKKVEEEMKHKGKQREKEDDTEMTYHRYTKTHTTPNQPPAASALTPFSNPAL
jgi:hypothetical protein